MLKLKQAKRFIAAAAFSLASASILTLSSTTIALAEYPEKPIKVILPYKAGGSTDTIARLIAAKVEEKNLLPQPLVIVNVPGASGAVGARRVLNAKPDGYTILNYNYVLLIGEAMGLTDFGMDDMTSLGFTGLNSPVWVVRKDSGLDTLADLTKALQDKPKSLVEAMGIGSIPHFVGAMLANQAGFETAKINAPSGADRYRLLNGKNADIALYSASDYVKFRDDSPIQALAFFGLERAESMPDVPTALELGYDVTWTNPSWWLAPKGVPQDIADKLSTAIRTAANDPEIVEFFIKNNVNPMVLDPKESTKRAAADLVRVKAIAATVR